MKVGALAGLFAAIPVVAVMLFVVTFLTPVVTTPGGSILVPSLGFLLMGSYCCWWSVCIPSASVLSADI